jgi:hypothetical protein
MKKSKIPTSLYLTAKPTVTVTKLELQSFLILATNSLWEVCTNREVEGLMETWLEAHPGSTKAMKKNQWANGCMVEERASA